MSRRGENIFKRADGRRTKVIVSEPKTEKSQRVTPIPAFLLKRFANSRGNDHIYIVAGTAKPVEPHCYYLRCKRFLRMYGVDDHTYHALRHTFATRCVEAGFDTKSLAEILGHESVVTTMMFYAHPSMEAKRTQMERLISPAWPAERSSG